MSILVVDDEKEVRDSLRDILKGAGYGVITASDGLEALECLKKHKVNMMLVDLSMPRMDGEELIISLYKEKRMPPSLVITAMAPWRMLGLMEHGVGYLRKPVNSRMLLDTIEIIMRRGNCNGSNVACKVGNPAVN